MLLPNAEQRRSFTAWMAAAGIPTPFHYPSLARSPAGRRYGRTNGTPVSDDVAECLVRLPLHHALTEADLDRVVERVLAWGPAERDDR
jgi:dTDP-4-amino-4,6-dideoxygalactose transaminase